MGVIVVIFLICTIFFIVAHLAYEAHGQSIMAGFFGLGAISCFIATLILGYFLLSTHNFLGWWK